MAEQPSKINIALAKVGMDKDTHPSQLNETQYTHAINANVETESGNSLNITNEKSNILITRYKPGFVLIGFENDILSNDTYVFLLNPTTGVGEFGVIKDNQNITNLEDITALCDDCQEVRQLATPLESITQVEIPGVYETLISDESALGSSNNTCLTRSNQNYSLLRLGFNFNVNYPIKKLVIKNEKCGKTIYFTDNFNPPRHINIENISQYYVQNVPCDDDITTDCIDFDELRIFKLYNIPQITPTSIQLGGELRMGMYEFLLAYCDAAGNEISPYYSITRPVSVFDKNNLIQGQENIADRTNFSIKLEVSGLDKRYSHYKVAVIQTADIEGVTRYFQEGIHTTNDNTVIYGSEQDKIATSIDKLLIDNLKVEQSEGLTASNNILFQYGLTLKKEINLQPVVNFMGQFLKWQTHIATENLYENGVIGSQYIGYNRDEVVPFGIRFNLLGGYETSIFPFIARAPKESDLDLLVIEGEPNLEVLEAGEEKDIQSILDNVLDCNTTDRTKRWQYYNTAEVLDENICEEQEVVYTNVETPITKVCLLEDIIDVPAGNFVIELDDDEYTTLAEYINLKKDNCPDEFYDEEGNLSSLCSYLEETQYDSIVCDEDLYANMVDEEGEPICDTPTTETEIELSKVESVESGSGESGFIDGDNILEKYNSPKSLVKDSSGNIYVADTDNHAIRKITLSGAVSTFAGNGVPGLVDDNGVLARFKSPNSITIDATSTFLYVADTGNSAIRKIEISTGAVTTFVTSVSTTGITIDSSDNLYITDTVNHLIKKIQPDTTITTLAGSGTPGFIDDTGTAATFRAPTGIIIDSTSTFLYVVDTGNNTIRKITLSGVVTTLVTSVPKLEQASGIAIDFYGNFYVTDTSKNSIRRITPLGVITDFVGSTSGASGSTDNTGTVATFNQPYGIIVDSSDDIYVADSGNNKIRKITLLGVVTTFSGGVTLPKFNAPRNTVIDSLGNIFITDSVNNAIRKVATDGTVTTFAGSTSGTPGFSDATGNAATFNIPYGMTIDSSDNLYITEIGNHSIRKITPAGVVTTLAGSGTPGSTDGTGTSATFSSPFNITIDSTGTYLYLADTGNHKIRKVTLTGVVTTFAGTGTPGFENGAGLTVAKFEQPYGITISSDGKIYVTDFINNAVRRITTAGVVTTVTTSISKLEQPRGIAISSDNSTLYVSDSINHSIRKIQISSGNITDFAGNGINGFVNESTIYAQFNQPFGLNIVDTDPLNSFIYISDTGNNVIRKINITTGIVTTFAGYSTFTYKTGAREEKVEKIFPTEYQVMTNPSFCSMYKTSTTAGGFLIDTDRPLGVYCGTPAPTVDNPNPVRIKEVYVRDSLFLNEVCGNAEEIKNNSKTNPNDASTSFFNNYYAQKTGEVTTFAGSIEEGTDDGEDITAQFYNPSGAVSDSFGNIYISDTTNHSIRKITPAGVVTTFAGTSGTPGSTDGIGTAASFNEPYGIAIDSTSTFLYVTDYGNNKIRKIEIATASVSNFATITEPRGITVATNGVCYVTAQNRVAAISASGASVTNLSGVAAIPGYSNTSGMERFDEPYGIAIGYNSSGVINAVYVADTNNHVIRLLGMPSTNTSTFAGSTATPGFVNAAKNSARFNSPKGLVIDSQRNLYVSDSENHAIRKVTSTRVSTIAGTGALGTNDGTGWEAEFNKPIGLCIIPSTIYPSSYTMYITDSDSHTIRKLVSSPESLLYTNKISTQFYYPVAGVEAQFYPQLSKNAIWFKGNTEGKERFIVDLSIQNNPDGDDLISVGSYVRLSLFKKCTNSTAIHSRLINLSNVTGAGMFLFERKNTYDLLITDLAGNSTLIVNGWFLDKKFLISIDTPIALMKAELEEGACANSNIVDVWVNSPTDGCFSITKRDIEYSRIFVSWSSIKLSKKVIYTATCNFLEPIPQSCRATPYKIGNSSFWESEQTYPDNNELYNSANLLISEDRIEGVLSSLTEETITEFKEVFTNGTTEDGNYIFKSEPWQDTTKEVADFTCRNIRHFKFPDNKVAPFLYSQQKSPLSESIIFPIGITIDENVINTFLDVAVDNSLLSPEDRKKIISYEIFRGDISLDRSVVASGLLFDMRRYSENNQEIYYSNYPYNTYSKDILNLGSVTTTVPNREPSVWGSSNRNYTFHSPETDYGKPTLPSELSLQGYMFGNSNGYFDEVKQHPKWVILSNSAYNLASSLATLEVTAEAIIKIAEVLAAGSGAYAFGWTAYFGWSSGVGSTQNPLGAAFATVASASVAILNTLTAVIFKYGRYRYEWLKIFRDLGTPHNFAYYYFSEGFYNYMDKEVKIGSNLRALNVAKYLNDGRYNITNEVTRENFKVNNIDRERSVLLSTGKSLIEYTDIYKNYDKLDSSLTTMTLSGLNQKGRSSEITKFIASPYAALKNYLPSQYNNINSVKWITTSFIGDLLSTNQGCTKVLPIFGGDTFISRHSFKRKIPLFLVTAMKQADLTPFNYFYYSNIGRNPKYYVSYEQNKDFSSGGKLFPEISSDFTFDNSSSSGNYYNPPSKFYLYYYGVPNFLTETRINTNYRYSGKEKKESFYPVCGDLGEWTQESVVPIREPNIFKYNTVYSKNSTFIRSRTLSPTYNRDFDDCVQDMPNGIMASLKDSTENSIYDPWLIYRPLDTFEFPSNYGKLKDIIDVESGAILARFDNTSVLYNKIDTKIDTGSAITATVLGGNMFFQRASTSFVNAKIGYGGTQNFSSISCEAGHFWVDAKRGQVLMLPPNSSGIQEISTSIGNKPSGLRNWFKEHLPFKILKSIPNADIDNPYNGVGITMGWDSRYRRVFITKKDYIPKPCVKFIKGVGYICEETIDEELVTTPVSLTNTNYFEDVSWTIAFSLNTGSWMSYYSFHPNYYISHNTYFQTGRNNAVDSSELGLWSHLLTNKSYQVFYGKKYPFVVEYPIKSEYATKRLGSVKLWTEAKRYSNEYDFSTNPDFTFNKSMVYNNVGCSGQLILDVQKPNLANTKEYPKTNQNGTQNILITCKDNFQFTYDYIFNRIKYNNTNIPFLLQDKNQIEKSPNSAVVKFYGINPLKKMEGDWFLNRLTYDTDSRFSLTLKFILNVTQNT